MRSRGGRFVALFFFLTAFARSRVPLDTIVFRIFQKQPAILIETGARKEAIITSRAAFRRANSR